MKDKKKETVSQIDTSKRRASYSRSREFNSHRTTNQPDKASQTKTKVKMASRHRAYLLLLSIFVSVFSVATPLLTDFANAYQSHSLYTGFMMVRGQLPYTDIFATGGFLYYGLIAISYFLGSSLWLVLVQFLAFYVSGTYLYKIVTHMTGKDEIAVNTLILFYVLNFSLGFGGLYPIQFAMPFVFISLWFLTRYFVGEAKDEGFIVYGLTGALAYLIEPRTLFFWLVSLLVIAVRNIRARQGARNVYQFLCLIFGGLLIFYTVGYFVLDLQVLSSYISQAGIYYFTYFALGKENLFLTMPFQLFVLFASGLLMGALTFFKHIRREDDRDDIIKVIVFVSFILNLVYVFLSQSFDTYSFLILLPFGLVLTSLYLDDKYKEVYHTGSRRRKRQRQSKKVLSIFVMSHFYLPYLILAYSLFLPIYSFATAVPLNQERGEIVSYLKQNTSSKELIYTWDSSAKVYLDSVRKSATAYPIPTVNTVKASNKKELEDELLQNESKFVLVNKDLTLSETLQKNLENNYNLISEINSQHFLLYQKK